MSDQQRKISELLEEVLKNDATDLHLCVGRPPILRIDGKLVPIEGSSPLSPDAVKEISLSLLNQDQQDKFWAQKDIDFAFSHNEKARFRANIFLQMGKIASAFRFIPSKIRTIEELNLPPILHQFARANQGFFLVVGPSGHGKSTALAAIIDEINHTRGDHIITI